MKRIPVLTMLTALLALWTIAVFAAVPQLINFQGILRDGSGNPVANGSYSVVFTIYDAASGGANLWSETQSVTTSSGLFTVLLGSVTPVPAAVFDNPDRWLGVKVGADPEMTPRQRLSSVGYSYNSAEWTSAGQDLFRLNGNVGIGTAPLGDVTKLDVLIFGSDPISVKGIRSQVENSSSGDAIGGYFATSSGGTGPHYGVYARGNGSGSVGVYGNGAYYGVHADNNFGLYGLRATSDYDAIWASANGSSVGLIYGTYSDAYNSSTGDAYGGYFSASSSGGSATGVYGSGSSRGVHGASYGGSGLGVYGESDYVGVDGNGIGASSGNIYGSYGYASNSYGGGFVAPAYGGYFEAYSSTGHATGVYASGSLYAGYFIGHTLATGSKSAAVKTDNGEYHLMYAEEATENWFEDFGTAQVVKGRAIVNLDPLYAQTVNTSITYHVFLTPEGDSRGLYVVNKTPNSFEIREQQNGKSDLAASYRIVAKRKGYEDVRLAKMEGPTPEEVQAQAEKHRTEQLKTSARNAEIRKQAEAERAKMEQERLIQEQKIKENK